MKHSLTNGFWFAKNSVHFNFNRLAMTLLFVASVTACNKEEFYQKDYLDNPYADDTSETTGGETAGVDSGVTSGSTDGTTAGGSTTGDSTSGSTVGGSTTGGSTSGGTVGGSTTGGSTTGDTTGGSTSGGTVGGSTTGSTTGGSTTGSTTGGSTTGSTTGGSTTGSTTGGIGDCNNGHGNDDDGVDDSNPGQGNGGPNASKDPNATEVCYAEEKFQQTAEQTKKIDILWVIDNSGSMADEQKALGENFDSFIKGFISKNVDFKMAITTTDTSSEAKKGAIVPGSTTALTSAAAKADEQKFYENFLSMVQVGIKGSGYEKGLAATEGFVSKYSNWIRPEAYLAVVILSDEEDQSSEAVKFYVDNLKAQKSQEGLVKVYTIVNANDVNTGGNTIGHVRYEEASKLTAGKMSDIMDRFDNVLLEMGDSIIDLLDSFALAGKPADGSLKVFVNGVESSAYSYDSASRSIKFHAGNLPPIGAQVTVKYIKVK